MLKTLPRRELLAGYAEIAKIGLILDAAFFNWCEENAGKLLALDDAALTHAIHAAVQHKAHVVMEDPEERSGARALLNLGHTFGHAYEALSGYSGQLLHGEAVTLGLVKAALLSAHLGYADRTLVSRITDHLAAVGLPTNPAFFGEFKPADIIARMRGDKKSANGKINFILLKGVGEAFIAPNICEDDIRAVL